MLPKAFPLRKTALLGLVLLGSLCVYAWRVHQQQSNRIVACLPDEEFEKLPSERLIQIVNSVAQADAICGARGKIPWR